MELVGGGQKILSRRERPHVVLGPDRTPIALTNGVTEAWPCTLQKEPDRPPCTKPTPPGTNPSCGPGSNGTSIWCPDDYCYTLWQSFTQAAPPAAPAPPAAQLLFANERLRVLDRTLPPRAELNVTHSVPTATWQVLDASEPTPPPRWFDAGGHEHVANPAPRERRDLVFEVLQPPRYTEAEVDALLAAPDWPTGVGSFMRLENAHARLWDFHSPVGMGAFHMHVLDNAWVVIGNGSLSLYEPDGHGGAKFDGTFNLTDRHVSWNPIDHGGFDSHGVPIQPAALHRVDNAAPTEYREYLIELK